MNPVYTLLVYVVWYLSTFFVVLHLLLILKNRDKIYDEMGEKIKEDSMPRVSVIIPAYNEGKTIGKTISSLLSVDYPKELLEVIVINDGSEDNTEEVVENYANEGKVIFINNKKNKGKAICLNEGIKKARGELIACMDADSIVKGDIIKKTITYFQKDEKTAAVTVRVGVINPKNILQKIIDIEYAIGLSLSLKVLSFLNSIHVTPGPFSIYRRDVLLKLNGFDEKSITEDLEIAYRIQKLGYNISCCLSTSVSTIVPADLKSLYKQRRRWYSGALLTLWKHKNLIFNKKVGFFGLFFLPFNYGLITLGLSLFLFSIYLTLSNIIKFFSHLRLTNYDILSNIIVGGIDPLMISIFYFFAFLSILATFLLSYVSFKIIKKKIRKNLIGFFGFVLFFFAYQVFWLGSFYNVIFKRRVKWR
jgi:cellulose synthase/poly-beta-1,6-N-acetylglucosamine synthase-like glycosyltransferase